MSLPNIKLTTCDSGDWEILEASCGWNFKVSGHRVCNEDWICLLEKLGYEVEKKHISDEAMEELC